MKYFIVIEEENTLATQNALEEYKIPYRGLTWKDVEWLVISSLKDVEWLVISSLKMAFRVS